MMISTKGRYALRMLVDMAEHERGNTYVPLKEIAARQEISEKYLESIVKLLVQNNVLIGVRGKGGGYPACGADGVYRRQQNDGADHHAARRALGAHGRDCRAVLHGGACVWQLFPERKEFF